MLILMWEEFVAYYLTIIEHNNTFRKTAEDLFVGDHNKR